MISAQTQYHLKEYSINLSAFLVYTSLDVANDGFILPLASICEFYHAYSVLGTIRMIEDQTLAHVNCLLS